MCLNVYTFTTEVSWLYAVSILVVLSCLLMLIIRFTFDSEFRKDVITGQGKAKIFKFISVSGALMGVIVITFLALLIVLLNQMNSGKDSIVVNPGSGWYAINSNGEFINPVVKTNKDSTVLCKRFDGTAPEINNLKLNLEKGELNVTGKYEKFGKIDINNLKETIPIILDPLDNDSILPFEDFKIAKFNKDKVKWTPKKNEFFDVFIITVEDTNKGTVYKITNKKTNEEVFNSTGKGIIFNKGEAGKPYRLFHIFEHKEKYYLFRIYSADISSKKDKHVSFFGIKLRPKLIR